MRSFGTTNLAPWSSAPAVGPAGETYFDTATGRLQISDGAAWQPHDVPPGGSTAQLLAKVDGNDWNTTWVTPPTFNSLSPLTTRGDLLTRDGSTHVRLGIGTSGTILRSNGTDPVWTSLASAGIQPLDDTLTALAGASVTANTILYGTGTDTVSATPLTAFARTLLDDTDAATALGTLGTYSSSTIDGLISSAAAGVGKRSRVRAATTATITISTALNNGDTLDGVTLATGDLVLVKDQSAPAENGVYVVGVSPARSSEFDTWAEFPGSLISVAEGTTNADTLWLCTSNDGGTLGSTAITFSKLNAFGALLAANNLSDLANVSTARSNLGLAIGTNVQAFDQDLTDIAALSRTRGDLMVGGASAWTRLPISATAGAIPRSNGTDLAYVIDPAFPTMSSSVSAGASTGGFVSGTQFIASQTYTQSTTGAVQALPGTGGVGVAFKSVHAVTLDDTTGGIFPLTGFTHGDGGISGPNGIFQQTGYVTYNHTNSLFSFTPIAMAAQITARSKSATNMTMTPSWGFISGHSLIADGGDVALIPNDTSPDGIGAAGGGPGAFIDNWAYWTVNGGSIDTTAGQMYHRGFVSAPAWLGDITFAGRVAFDVHDVNITGDSATINTAGGIPSIMGGGTVDTNTTTVANNIGLRIGRMVNGTANYGFQVNTRGELSTDDYTFTTAPEGPPLTIGGSGTKVFNVPSNGGAQVGLSITGTWQAQQATSAFGFFVPINIAPTISNVSGVSGTLIPGNSMASIVPVYQVLGGVSATFTTLEELHIRPQFSGNSSLTIGTHYGVRVGLGNAAGSHITTQYGIKVEDDGTGTGTITNNYGVYVDALAEGTSKNFGFYHSGSSVFGTIYGSESSAGDLLLKGTTHATPGRVWLQNPLIQFGTSSAYTLSSGTFGSIVHDQDMTMSASNAAGGNNSYLGYAHTSTLTFTTDGSQGFFTAIGLSENMTVTNSGSVALGNIGSFNAAPSITVTGSGATMSVNQYVAVNSSPTFARFINGTMTVTSTYGLLDKPAIGTGVTVTSRYGVYIQNPTTLTGTLTNQYGIWIDTLNGASTNNLGIVNFSPSVLLGTVAGDYLTGGNLTISSTLHATKGTIYFDNPLFELGVSAYTNTASGTYQMIKIANTLSMNNSGGGAGSGNAVQFFVIAPTVTWTQTGNVFAAASAFADQTAYHNATNSGPLGSFNSSPTINADATTTTSNFTGFNSGNTLSRTGAFTLTVTNYMQFYANTLNVGAGTTIGTRYGLRVADVNNAGTVTTNYGVFIPAMTGGSTNVGISNASSLLQSGAATLSGTNTLSGATTATAGLTINTTALTITDVNVVLSTSTGTQFGTATGQKLAFYGKTPVIQPASANQAAVGTTAPAGGTGTAAGGWSTSGNRDTAITTINSLVTLVNQLRSDLVSLGLIKGSA